MKRRKRAISFIVYWRCGTCFSLFVEEQAKACSTNGLHHRSDAPWHELLVSQALGAGLLARCYPEHQVKDFVADLRHCHLAIGDRAAVDVHVVPHAVVGDTVTGDLDHRNGRKANGAAAAGGERDQIAAACGKASERSGIVSRRIHEDKTWGSDLLGIVDYI